MRPILNRSWLQTLHHVWSPTRCMACDDYFDDPTPAALCARCAPRLYPLSGKLCERCGHPMQAQRREGLERHPGRCQACELREPVFDEAASLWRYDGVISQVLPRVKYSKDEALMAQLARYAAPALVEQLARWRGQIGQDELPLVPMPMTRWRLAWRGFNTPTLMGQAIQRQLALPATTREAGAYDAHAHDAHTHDAHTHDAHTHDAHMHDAHEAARAYPLLIGALRRRRHWRRQARLSLAQRRANVQDALVWRWPEAAPLSVCLLDDVLTTGASAEEAARALKEAGAARVFVLTLARATQT